VIVLKSSGRDIKVSRSAARTQISVMLH